MSAEPGTGEATGRAAGEPTQAATAEARQEAEATARQARRGDAPRFPSTAPRARPGLLVATAALLTLTLVLVGVLWWRASSSGDAGSPTAAADAGAPREVTVAGLRAYATGTRALYWAGELPDRRLELTATSDGRSYVRYLPPGVAVGDERPAYTTVATYPQADAHGLLTQRADAGDERAGVASGGLATWSADRPTSVYLAYPGYDYLVEVFDPDAARARELVTSGQVRPVG